MAGEPGTLGHETGRLGHEAGALGHETGALGHVVLGTSLVVIRVVDLYTIVNLFARTAIAKSYTSKTLMTNSTSCEPSCSDNLQASLKKMDNGWAELMPVFLRMSERYFTATTDSFTDSESIILKLKFAHSIAQYPI